MSISNDLRAFAKARVLRARAFGKRKIFCIGLNKTGTTSVKKAWQELGIAVGDQQKAQSLLSAWIDRDFKPIVKYCKTAQAFQDSPFSFPFTYIALDAFYPKSKFILTVRDSPEQWYQSLTKFHSKLWAKDGMPTKDDLLNAVNGTKGRPWVVNRALFNSPESEPYKKDVLIKFYLDHEFQVKEYFKFRENDLLIINVGHSDSYMQFCEFLNQRPVRNEFPWENKT